VGNSLPTAVLERCLKGSWSTDVLRISLSRNDGTLQGLTRQDLLRKKLEVAKISKNDIIVYLDEWNTGVNFNRVSELLTKLIPSGAFLFCAGMLTSLAESHERYGSFCKDHDIIMKQWGQNGSEFRAVLPRIPSRLRGGGYFFWSENDRMSGFRKMQIHGSIFSTFDTTIQRLRENDSDLRRAIEFQVAEISREQVLPKSGKGAGWILKKMFLKGCEVYEKCRGELRACAEDLAAGGEADLDTALNEVIKRQAKVINQNDVKIVFILAHAYLKRLGSGDPVDRYLFKQHAPTLIRLKGRAARTHEITLRFITDRLGHS
jgi:hypothetical protein